MFLFDNIIQILCGFFLVTVYLHEVIYVLLIIEGF